MDYTIKYQIKPHQSITVGDYLLDSYHTRLFETKEEAIKSAYDTNPYLNWYITEVIIFNEGI